MHTHVAEDNFCRVLKVKRFTLLTPNRNNRTSEQSNRLHLANASAWMFNRSNAKPNLIPTKQADLVRFARKADETRTRNDVKFRLIRDLECSGANIVWSP
jgi:hypothetical protein